MSILRNLVGAFMPHFEQRRSSALLAAVNAELVHPVNGDNSATIFIGSAGTTLNATYNVQGTIDGTNYFDLLAYSYGAASTGGALPQPGQPLVSEAVNVVMQRALCVSVGGLQALRIRLTAFTAGTCQVTINSDDCDSISPYVRDQKAGTLMWSQTAAAGVGIAASLPAVPGLRHYIDRITVIRSATAALTPAATPVLVTTTNIPGNLVLTFGQDAAGAGIDREQTFDFGSAGMAASAINTATSITCPAYVGVIWRINASYRLGL